MDPLALGRYLRESREAKEITLEDAVSALRIRQPILEAFERGEFGVADSPVQVRGLLRNYARYLGLDEEQVLQYYQAAQEENRRNRRKTDEVELVAPAKITDTPPALPAVTIYERSGGWVRTLLIFIVSGAALGFIVFVALQIVTGEPSPDNAVAAAETATPDPALVTPSATFTASWTPRPVQPTVTTDFSTFGSVSVIVDLVQRSWVRILVDGVEQFVGILEPGERLEYQGSDQVQIMAANAAALDIVFNGEEQEAFGTRGQQVELEFALTGITVTKDDEVLATATATQTPLPTPTPLFQELLPTSTAEADDSPTAAPRPSDAAPQATSAEQNLSAPTPTPLFQQAEQSGPSPTRAITTTDDAVTVQAPTQTAAASNTPVANPTATAVLPLRATPEEQVPTKTDG